MRIEQSNEEIYIKLEDLESGECFSVGGSTLYLLTAEQRKRPIGETLEYDDQIMAVDVEDGDTHWFSEIMLVRPVRAKVVTEQSWKGGGND